MQSPERPGILRQVIRGCGDLPHVGSHPGTAMLFLFLLMGAMAGEKGGVRGMLGGAAFMAVFFVPIYLYGAYDRAQLSDRLSSKEPSHGQ